MTARLNVTDLDVQEDPDPVNVMVVVPSATGVMVLPDTVATFSALEARLTVTPEPTSMNSELFRSAVVPVRILNK